MSAILAKARSYIGKFHDGPDVPRMTQEIGKTFPEFAEYGKQANNATPWCGIFVAYVLSQFGIKPPPTSGGVGYMWVDTWLKFGTSVPVGSEKPGDIALYLNTPHHINFVAGGGKYVGGNQGNAVSEISYRKPDAIRRPPALEPKPVSGRFEVCLPRVLKHEGGNDDDARDPGGRTSRGITAARWAEWRQTHPGLPEDVWQAPQAEVEAIYREKYWDVLWCDELPPGVDYAVFDFGVNSGPARSAKFLQEIVGSDPDGEVGPNTIAAVKAADGEEVVERLCDDRMTFLQGLSTWETYKNGWTTRVKDVRRDALIDWGEVKEVVKDDDKPDDTPITNPALEAALKEVTAALRPILEKHLMPAPAAQFDWGKLLQPIIAELAPKLLPMLMPLIVQMLPQLIPHLLNAFFKQPQQSVMSKPGVQMAASGGIGALLATIAAQFLQVK